MGHFGEDSEHKGGETRRRHERRRVLQMAQLVYDRSVLDCFVLDISPAGARVKLGVPATVPETGILKLRDGPTFTAFRRWTRGTEIGLELAERTHACHDEHLVQHVSEALKAVQAAKPDSWLTLLRSERFFSDEKLRQVAEANVAAHEELEETLKALLKAAMS